MIALLVPWLGAKAAERLAGILPYVMVAGLGMALLTAAYVTGGNAERKRGEAATLRAQLEALRVDLTATRQAAQASARDRDRETVTRTQLEGQISDYARQLAARGPSGACRLDGRDVDRLRRITR